ncbi:DUF4291 family protein [Streptomyces sp. GD-15H]|uniref:DUF4291 family protein n=1 Tax=Streptomyces sp. GD-15H TaxID=3129112 RepID=UPI00387335A2
MKTECGAESHRYLVDSRVGRKVVVCGGTGDAFVCSTGRPAASVARNRTLFETAWTVRTECTGPERTVQQGLKWIKPSFLWMMYRCGWHEGRAGDRSCCRLAAEIARDDFEGAMRNACLPSGAGIPRRGRTAGPPTLVTVHAPNGRPPPMGHVAAHNRGRR